MWKADFYGWSNKVGHHVFLHSIEEKTRELAIGKTLRILEAVISFEGHGRWIGVKMDIADHFHAAKKFDRVVIQRTDGFEIETFRKDDLKKLIAFL